MQGSLPGLLRDYYRWPTENLNVRYLGQASQLMSPGEPVIILSANEWSSFAPYYLKRRAFIASLFERPADLQPVLDSGFLKRHGFRWLLVEGRNDSRLVKMATQITSRWKTATEVNVPSPHPAYALYRLSDS
jgi:hypothetical protein